MGQKETESAHGITATKDHLIKTGNSWLPWEQIISDPEALNAALSTGNSPYSDYSKKSAPEMSTDVGTLGHCATAAKSKLYGAAHSLKKRLFPATNALEKDKQEKNGPYTKKKCLTKGSDQDCLGGLVPQSVDAITKMTRVILGTAGEAYTYTRGGGTTTDLFYSTSKIWKAGTTKISKLTGSITTKDTNRETYILSPEQKTAKTEGLRPNLKRVYDLLSVSETRSFTILSNKGPIIVHNCELGLGFGMGYRKFRRQCAIRGDYMSLPEASAVINMYRGSRPGVPRMWKMLDMAIGVMADPNGYMEIGPITIKYERIELPNGFALHYPNLTYDQDEGWTYGNMKKPSFLWGGTLLENIVQCLARIILGEHMLHMDKEVPWAPLISSTHDETLNIVDENMAPDAFSLLSEIMSRSPTWAPDLPLVGEGSISDFYLKD